MSFSDFLWRLCRRDEEFPIPSLPEHDASGVGSRGLRSYVTGAGKRVEPRKSDNVRLSIPVFKVQRQILVELGFW